MKEENDKIKLVKPDVDFEFGILLENRKKEKKTDKNKNENRNE